MPELPEVESVGRALAAELTGRRLTGLRVRWGGVFEPSARAARDALLGRRLDGLHRHGKYLIARFAGPGGDDAHLMIHLRMTGQFLSQPDCVPDRHVHVTFDFEGRAVHFRDVRKFGRLTLVEHPTAPAALAHVGPDMLTVRTADWLERARRRAAPFKSVLLDQGVAAGLGNIYADEVLHRARISPLRPGGSLEHGELAALRRAIRPVLRAGLRRGGTSLGDLAYLLPDGRAGEHLAHLAVYGRDGEVCRRCGSEIVRTTIRARSSHWCPGCQA